MIEACKNTPCTILNFELVLKREDEMALRRIYNLTQSGCGTVDCKLIAMGFVTRYAPEQLPTCYTGISTCKYPNCDLHSRRQLLYTKALYTTFANQTIYFTQPGLKSATNELERLQKLIQEGNAKLQSGGLVYIETPSVGMIPYHKNHRFSLGIDFSSLPFRPFLNVIDQKTKTCVGQHAINNISPYPYALLHLGIQDRFNNPNYWNVIVIK